jgi:hypothetical protein
LFFTNSYRKETITQRIAYDLGGKGLWRWNPETGERTPYEMPYSATEFEIRLQPLESVLLVTGEKTAPLNPPVSSGAELLTLTGGWRLNFQPAGGGEGFSLETDTLFEFTTHPEEMVRYFSGAVTYSTTFEWQAGQDVLLQLGEDQDFISDISLNGKQVGVNWYGSMQFDISQQVKAGENLLEITYTTTLWNMMRQTETGTLFFDKYRRQPSPPKKSGLLGPVQLFEKEIHIKD